MSSASEQFPQEDENLIPEPTGPTMAIKGLIRIVANNEPEILEDESRSLDMDTEETTSDAAFDEIPEEDDEDELLETVNPYQSGNGTVFREALDQFLPHLSEYKLLTADQEVVYSKRIQEGRAARFLKELAADSLSDRQLELLQQLVE